jgi:anthranilate synthase component 1
VGAYLKLAYGQPNTFLLESIEGGSARGRYSVIGMAPDLIWRCRHGVAEINRHARSAPHAFVPEDRPALDSLRALVAETHLVLPAGMPPMIGGLVGYLGYDMVRLMEKLPEASADDLGLPEATLLRPTLFAVFDNVRDELTLAAPIYPAEGIDDDAAWADAQNRLSAARAALERPLPHAAPPVDLAFEHDTRGFPGSHCSHEGVYRGGRCLSDRAEPAFFRPIRLATFCAVSRFTPDKPGPLSILSRFWRIFGGRQ